MKLSNASTSAIPRARPEGSGAPNPRVRRPVRALANGAGGRRAASGAAPADPDPTAAQFVEKTLGDEGVLRVPPPRQKPTGTGISARRYSTADGNLIGKIGGSRHQVESIRRVSRTDAPWTGAKARQCDGTRPPVGLVRRGRHAADAGSWGDSNRDECRPRGSRSLAPDDQTLGELHGVDHEILLETSPETAPEEVARTEILSSGKPVRRRAVSRVPCWSWVGTWTTH